MTLKITMQEVELIAHQMVKKLLSWDEPIPDFNTRQPKILESCLSVPFQTFDRKSLYRSLIDKGAILFYLLIKNHPFQNGNKRVAITTLLVFLAKNGRWLRVDHQELYNFLLWVAASPSDYREEVVAATKKFIGKNLIDY